MTTIVKHRRNGYQYILLGINGEANNANPSRFISELFEREKPQVSCSATVCDALGNLFIADIDDLTVIEIDGIKPSDILPEVNYEPDTNARTYSAPTAEFEQDLSEELDEEFDEEFDEEPESNPTPTIPTKVSDSLDAPSSDDDEDWI